MAHKKIIPLLSKHLSVFYNSKLFFYCCFLFFPFISYSNLDSLQADQYFQLAIQAVKKNKSDSVTYYADQSLQIFAKNNDLYNWVNVLKKIAANWTDQGQPLEATIYFEKAIQQAFRQSNTAREWKNQAWLEANIGYNFSAGLGDFKSGILHYENAKRIFLDTLHQEDFLVAKYIYNQLGNMYTRTGDYEKALLYLEKVKTISLTNEAFDKAAEALGDMGIAYHSMQKYDSAIVALKQGLALPNLSPLVQSFLLNNLGLVYFQKNDFDNALHFSQKGKKILDQSLEDKISRKQRMRMIDNHENFGMIYRSLGNFEDAVTHYQATLQLYQDHYASTKRREIGKLYIEWARLYQQWGIPLLAHKHLQKALSCVLPDFDEKQINLLPKAEELYAENTIMEALLLKAELYEESFHKDGQESKLINALQCHELIFKVEHLLRISYQFESSKLILLEESRLRTEKAIDIAYQLWQSTSDDLYLEYAFNFAEQSKSMVLLESLKDIAAKNATGIPPSLLQKEQEVKTNYYFYQQALIQAKLAITEGKEKDLTSIRSKLLESEEAQNKIIQHLEKTYPEYFQRKYQVSAISIADVQNKILTNETQLIEYFDGLNYLFAFQISAQKVHLIKIKKEKKIKKELKQLVQLISTKIQSKADIEKYQQLAFQAYQILLAPFQSQSKKLIIIPDGNLFFLSFEALLKTNQDHSKPTQLDYLLRHHIISYAYSATILSENKKHEHLAPFSCLGMAPVEFLPKDNLPDLTESVSEMNFLKNILDGHTILHEKATKDFFLKEAPQYDIIVLSTHAAGGENPWVSFADKKLYLPELYATQIQARLVVLSACETGLGKLKEGEGVMSLARGFAYSGVPSIIMSLWSVNQNSTNKILNHFYLQLKKGISKSEALNQAKLNYLENASNIEATPYHWSALVNIGNTAPLYNNSNKWWSFIIGGLLILLISFKLINLFS